MIYALAITGPTASGKTALSIEVAKQLGCEIISLDSMQIYRGMDIGTAKATREEQSAVPHHMIDVISPSEAYSAKAYRDAALAVAKEISSRGKIPLFVGGTGLYLSTLMRPECEEAPRSDPEYELRQRKKLLTGEDRIALWQRLSEVDPESAENIHYNNVRRVIRALEIFDATGKTKTYFDSLTKKKNDDITITHVTLDFHERELLYSAVDKRVDIMLSDGLCREVESLLEKGLLPEDSTAAQAIGYKEIIAALKEGRSADSAADEIKQASRNYAKRQLTWFRHDSSATHVFIDRECGKRRPMKEILAEILSVFRSAQVAQPNDLT